MQSLQPRPNIPATPAFNQRCRNLRGDIDDLLSLTVRRGRRQAAADTLYTLAGRKKDLRRWTNLLEKDLLTTEDFEFLVNSQQDSMKMTTLKQSGLALVRMDQFKYSFFNLIIDTIFDVILGPKGKLSADD